LIAIPPFTTIDPDNVSVESLVFVNEVIPVIPQVPFTCNEVVVNADKLELPITLKFPPILGEI
jgi:hypothetical protein